MMEVRSAVVAIFVWAVPALAAAHPGHEHVGQPAQHHLVEWLLLASVTALALFLGAKRNTRA